MSKYEEFDAALLNAIRNGADKLDAMCGNAKIKALAQPLREKDRWGHLTEVFRIIDRRLQALRKKGRIAYTGARWVVQSGAA